MTAADVVGDLVTARGLSVRYLGTRSWVLDGVGLRRRPAGATAVIGPSGCGKTTLIRTLCGLVPHCLPSEYTGTVLLGGEEIADASVAAIATRVAYVGQDPDAAVVTRRVFDEVAFPLRNLRLPAEEIRRRVIDAVDRVGLLPRLWCDPWELSGGQRQRLAIAVAVAMEPELLILDEPTSTIDASGREHIHRLLAGLVGQGIGVVIIDHDLDPVLDLVDHVIVLDSSGGVIADGEPDRVFDDHREQLRAIGVWLPRRLRGAPERPPRLEDFTGSAVRYHRRGEDGTWHEVDAIDTVAGAAADGAEGRGDGVEGRGDGVDGRARCDACARVDVRDLRVPGRSPGVSMRLAGGEIIAVVGANGAGKSSLLGALAGIVAHEATSAAIGGTPLRRGRHLVGHVFQNPEHQVVSTSVEGELAVTGADAATRDALLARFHLDGLRDRHPLTLSGGQCRRLSVATMVAEAHDVIVLDEPTYGQDWDNTVELMDFIHRLRDEGRTVIIATHDLDLAVEHCTHIIGLPAPDPAHVGSTADDGDGRPDPGGAGTAPRRVPAEPETTPGIFDAVTPLTPFVAVVPLMVAVIALRCPVLSIAVMMLVFAGLVSAGLPARRVIACTATYVLVAAVLFVLFLTTWSGDAAVERIYDHGTAVEAATGIGALLALALFTSAVTTGERVVEALVGICRLPYRVGAAATSALAFLTLYRRDFRLLRTARAVRGIGDSWGPLAPVVRWAGSLPALLVLAVQHAERVALSMDSRAFGAHPTRTTLHPVRWGAADTITVAAAWALTAAVAAAVALAGG